MTDLISLSGWLKRKMSVFGIKAKKWCTCTCHTFFIFSDENAKFPDMTMTITTDTKIEHVCKGKTFMLTVWNSDKENVELYADSSEELMRWGTVLKNAPSQTIVLSIDDFTPIRVIGNGYYGKVMLVTKKDTDEKFAIKSIHKSRLIQDKRSHSALAERNILLRASHPFIVQLKFAFQTPSKFYFGLEYASGGELFARVQKSGGLSEKEVRFYLSEIVLALSYLHSLGIIYRDLKPENILLDEEGHVKLTDFGLSKDLNATSGAQTFCGTYEYIAPEIAQHQPYSYEVDWWAIGILAYEMVMQVTPFFDKSQSRILEKIVNEDVSFPVEIPSELASLIAMLLRKDPKKRAKYEDVIHHPFFSGVNWDDVYQRKIKPYYIPDKVETEAKKQKDNNEDDTAMDSYGTPVLGDEANVSGFSFTGLSDSDVPEPSQIDAKKELSVPDLLLFPEFN
ncbi:AGC family protein kinase [Trichomonas vaginalis G3]|uniref:AGC family protein kinase n=1 Tax=Trichomonas vaginalis (strain ATCC PRA-98 / G3) TaxID=412133 RepID=A2E5K8_TRIV3|nr:protein serine/threonine kinase protein [Trichomonas vaginalis G3]EAY12049.1 AGC family protein kinase [Trichomonas vaginalis G3]KAI5553267.1 protein serine/threonine kinase protein [Trichomonas vaginalis G3]|eukprot:XP_001324272.1 AGC family protein kinase [Trichomonas vaginalis G3]